MAISIKHVFQSLKSDGVDSTLVQPSNWNAALATLMATGRLLGRTTAGAGSFEEILPNSVNFSFTGGALDLGTAVAFPGTGAVKVPVGTTAQRPGAPAIGMIRYNTTLNIFEKYEGASPSWQALGNITGYQPLNSLLTDIAALQPSMVASDLLIGTAGSVARFPKGADGTSLKVVAGALAWGASGSTVLDSQTIIATGIWTKPAGLTGNDIVTGFLYGGGGGGGSSAGRGGGGGGCCVQFWYKASDLGATEAVTIGGGGAIATVGGDSTFKGVTAFGGAGGSTATAQGGGGGGSLSAGAAGVGGGPAGGAATGVGSAFGGGGGNTTSAAGGQSHFGGGGGGGGGSTSAGAGGASVYGGGGGGGGAASTSAGAAGSSAFGGSGGAGSAGGTGAAGSIPGGGGGGGVTGGVGARGELRIWVIRAVAA